MKSTIRLLLTAVTLAVVTSVPMLRAQDAEPKAPPPDDQRPPHGPRGPGRGAMMDPEKRIEQLDKALSLTADQKAKIRDIYVKAREEAVKAREEAKDLAPEERRAKMMEMIKAIQDQVRAVLTPDQQTKFDALPKPGPGGPRGEGRGKRPE